VSGWVGGLAVVRTGLEPLCSALEARTCLLPSRTTSIMMFILSKRYEFGQTVTDCRDRYKEEFLV
jgi:hypothetical protein